MRSIHWIPAFRPRDCKRSANLTNCNSGSFLCAFRLHAIGQANDEFVVVRMHRFERTTSKEMGNKEKSIDLRENLVVLKLRWNSNGHLHAFIKKCFWNIHGMIFTRYLSIVHPLSNDQWRGKRKSKKRLRPTCAGVFRLFQVTD